MVSLLLEKIKKIRKITGAGFSDCKNALIEAKEDVDKAIELLKSVMIVSAHKKSCLQVRQGAVFCVTSVNFSRGILVKLLCETDFVAKNSEFLQILKNIASFCLLNNITSINDLNSLKVIYEFGNVNFETFCCILSAKFGENIKLDYLEYLSITNVSGIIGSYVHFRNNIPVLCSLVVLENNDIQLANDLAVHVVANNPIVVDLINLPYKIVEEKRNCFTKEFFEKNLCDPTEEVISNFLIKSFQEEVLLFQFFVFNNAETVNSLLLKKRNRVICFRIIKVEN